MAFCPLCEKKFKDRRGLHGHFRFFHGFEYGSGRPAKKTILTEAIRRNIRERTVGAKDNEKYEEEKPEELLDIIFRGFRDDKGLIYRGFEGDEEYGRKEKEKGVIHRLV